MTSKEKELESIKKEILSTLDQLNEQQQKDFAWRCAIRVLPALRKFDFWKDVDIEPIFMALDLMSYGGIYTEEIIKSQVAEEFKEMGEFDEILKEQEIEFKSRVKKTFSKAASSLKEIYSELKEIERDADAEIPEDMEDEYDQDDDYFDSDDYYELASDISGTVEAAQSLLNITKFFYKKKKTIQDVARQTLLMAYHLENSIDLAAYKNFDENHSYYFDNPVGFATELLNDLKAITSNQKPTFSAHVYDLILKEFDTAVREIGFEHLADLYQEIINNDFGMDIEQLKERISSII